MNLTRFQVLPGGQYPPPPDAMPPLTTWSRTTAWLEQLNNADLALLLTQYLLLHLTLGTPAHDLLSEAIERLEGAPHA